MRLESSWTRRGRFAAAIYAGLTIAVCGSTPAAAAYIVDTGVPSSDPRLQYNLSDHQYFAGEFTITEAFTIQSVEGWLGMGLNGTPGTVAVSINADAGDVPGAALFSQSFSPDPTLAWQGVSALDWTLAPGTYWAAFVPDADFNGIMPGIPPNPMEHYARSQDGGDWQPLGPPFDEFTSVGIRISADQAIGVPEPGTLGMLGVGLLSLASVVRRKREN